MFWNESEYKVIRTSDRIVHRYVWRHVTNFKNFYYMQLLALCLPFITEGLS